jgi:hypothetical protein
MAPPPPPFQVRPPEAKVPPPLPSPAAGSRPVRSIEQAGHAASVHIKRNVNSRPKNFMCNSW